jgi:hypothetical protein
VDSKSEGKEGQRKVCTFSGKPSFSKKMQANEKWRRKGQSEQEPGASATLEWNALDVIGQVRCEESG